MNRPQWVADDLYPFEDRWEGIDGATVHYVDEGEGRPILMVHGNPTWSFLYRDVIRGLYGDFRCIALDLPGFGLSTPAPGYRFHPQEHATVLARLIECLDLRDYVLMGQDWGGPIGLAAAARSPERVAGLVLGNTWAWSMASRLPAHVWSLGIGGVPGRQVVERLNAFVRVAMRFGTHEGRPAGRVMEHYERPFPTAASRRPTWVFARAVTGASTWLEHEVAPALRTLSDRPALLPWGDRDPVFPLSARDRLEAQLPHAETVTLEGAGHFIQEDAPGEIALAIREWAGGGRRDVHPEAPAVTLAQAVPAADRVLRRPAPRLDGAGLRLLLLVGGAERHPVAVLAQHRVQVLDAARRVAQLGRPDLHDERVVLAVGGELGAAGRRPELPGVVLRSVRHR
jgi:haloalkane dehalogenase